MEIYTDLKDLMLQCEGCIDGNWIDNIAAKSAQLLDLIDRKAFYNKVFYSKIIRQAIDFHLFDGMMAPRSTAKSWSNLLAYF